VNIDDIISYSQLVAEERVNLQKGMNFGAGKQYSIFLMSIRKGAPYADEIDRRTGMLIYEGHDHPKTSHCPNPKLVDQPLTTPRGSWTENGKFFGAAMDFKSGVRTSPELIKVYEKISAGIWCYKGFFELVDAKSVKSGKRKVFKFLLRPIEKRIFGGITELPHTRLIPTHVKVEVWKRDKGRCVECGSDKNLHYDHDIPLLQRRQQPRCRECSPSLCQAQPREVRQDHGTYSAGGSNRRCRIVKLIEFREARLVGRNGIPTYVFLSSISRSLLLSFIKAFSSFPFVPRTPQSGGSTSCQAE
jgi:hypothetical protein